MKHFRYDPRAERVVSFSALGRAVWDETQGNAILAGEIDGLSVLSVEPYGMKLFPLVPFFLRSARTFSALGRAVWDETTKRIEKTYRTNTFSALGRAVWDETRRNKPTTQKMRFSFSALGRAVWDETLHR